MLYSVDDLTSYEIAATDGKIGQIRGFYFDVEKWKIHYLVVDTGSWLPGRKVLVSPMEFLGLNNNDKSLAVNLSRDQIEKSPAIDKDAPISETTNDLNSYYGWSAERTKPGAVSFEESDFEEELELRSTYEVTGFYVEARDGDIGHVEDFIIDDEDWSIRYMVIDTANWMPGKKVLVFSDVVDDIGWDDQKVFVSLKCDEISNSPEFDPDNLPSRQYEESLYGHYGRTPYWTEPPLDRPLHPTGEETGRHI